MIEYKAENKVKKVIRNANEKFPALLIGLPAIYIYLSELSVYFPLTFLRWIVYPVTYLIGLLAYYQSFRLRSKNVLLFIGAALVVILSPMIFPETFKYLIGGKSASEIILSDLFLLFFISLPTFLLMLCPKENSLLFESLSKMGIIVMLLFVLTFTLKAFVFNDFFDYMNMSYGVLPWTLFTFGYSFINKKRWAFLLSLVSLAFIMIGGCRGAALTAIIFVLLMTLVLTKGQLTKMKLAAIAFGIIAAILILINLDSIITRLYSFLIERGFNSRTFELYLGIGYEKGLGHYSDRAALQTPMLENLRILGYGLYGDRVMSSTNQYAHNLFLEWGINFGIIVGGILGIYFLYNIFSSFKMIFHEGNISTKLMVCAAISILCCKYMISSSYLHAPEFWLFLGLIIAVNKDRSTNSVQ